MSESLSSVELCLWIGVPKIDRRLRVSARRILSHCRDERPSIRIGVRAAIRRCVCAITRPISVARVRARPHVHDWSTCRGRVAPCVDEGTCECGCKHLITHISVSALGQPRYGLPDGRRRTSDIDMLVRSLLLCWLLVLCAATRSANPRSAHQTKVGRRATVALLIRVFLERCRSPRAHGEETAAARISRAVMHAS